MTGVGRDLPPFMLAFGGHDGAVRGLNLIGLRRMQLPRENLSAVRDSFRIFWLSGLTKEAALAEMTAKYSAIPEVMELTAFIRASARGVLPLDKDAEKDSRARTLSLMPQDRIGIIAGSGQFPLLLARAAKAKGLSVAICGFAGHADPALAAEADAFELLPIGQLNKLIKFFQSQA